MTFDTVLSAVGENGIYQRRVFFAVFLLTIPMSHHACSVIFNTREPLFRCAVPGLLNDTYDIQNEAHRLIVNSSIPFNADTGKYSQCSKYESSHTGDWTNESTPTSSCDRWVYESSVGITSIVPDLNLVCERKIYSSHFGMMIMLGNLLGSLFGGPMSDRFGRKKMFISCTVLQAVTGIGMAFVDSVPAVLAIRLLLSMMGMCLFMSVFVLVAEIVGPTKRTFITIEITFTWSIGLLTLTFICYMIPNWRTAQLVMSAPSLLAVFGWWHIPESPRWLLSRGRNEEAKRILLIMSKVNKMLLPSTDELDTMLASDDSDDLEKEKSDTGPPTKIWHLFTDRTLLTRMAILSYGWSAVSMVYYGLTLNVGDLVEGSLYVNFGLQAVMEVLAGLIIFACIGKVGRKKIYCGAILAGGLACLSTAGPVFAHSDIKWINVALYSIGKLGLSAAFSLIYIVTAELLPTVVRNTGLGLCSFLGRIIGMLSPYVASLGALIAGTFGQAFPLLLFGLVSILAGILALMLPETKDRKLPETIEDMKNFSRSKPKELNIQTATI